MRKSVYDVESCSPMKRPNTTLPTSTGMTWRITSQSGPSFVLR